MFVFTHQSEAFSLSPGSHSINIVKYSIMEGRQEGRKEGIREGERDGGKEGGKKGKGRISR